MRAIYVDRDGNYRDGDGRLHREDGPAIRWSDGSEFWHFDNQPHRINGPAISYNDGGTYWYIHGKRHRIDGPAIEDSNGNKYYLNGKEYSYEDWDRVRKMLWLL